MNKLYSLCLVALSAVSILRSEAQPYRRYDGASTYETPPSQIKFESQDHDFGTILEVEGPVNYKFKYKNISNQPFVIGSVSVSCGCTTSEYSKEPLAPGAVGEIKVSFDPYNRPGYFEKIVFITPVLNRRSQSILTIKGDVLPRPRTVEDDYPLYLGHGIRITTKVPQTRHIAINAIDTITIGIVNHNGSEPVEVGVEHGTLPDYVRIVVPKSTLNVGERDSILVIVDALKHGDYGMMHLDFGITVNGVVNQDERVLINSFFVDDFKSQAADHYLPKPDYSSAFYHFGVVEHGDILKRIFTVTNTGVGDFLIRKIISTNPSNLEIICDKYTIATGDTATISTTLYTATATNGGRFSESLWLITNDQLFPVKEIRIVSHIKEEEEVK